MTTVPPKRRRGSRPNVDSVKAPIRRPALPIPGPPNVRPVALTGAYADNAAVIPRTAATLVVIPGLMDEESDAATKVMVPFAEVRLLGGRIEDVASAERAGTDELPFLLDRSLPLENLAFILLDLTSDLRRMCSEVGDFGDGKLAVDPARMAMVRYYVAHLERHAKRCRLRLDAVYGVPEALQE